MIFSLLSSIVFYFIWKVFVNNNLKPVEQSINSMQDFVHNAWHELKTPISIIHWNLQLIRQVKKYNKELTNESINELEKLNKLIEWLIELSDINTNLEKKNINITEELEDILKDLNEEIEKKQINIKKSFNNKATISANKQYFYIFVSNIIRNAIKYNKDWWSIEITIKKNIFTIKDNWIWIEKKELKKIFDRFYKIDKSRSSSWYGIWLSLVKKIADIYSRNIKIESELWRWTNFKVFF